MVFVLVLFPLSVCFGVTLEDIPAKYSYPEEIQVNVYSEGTETLLIVRDNRPLIIVVPLDRTIVIGNHAYIFTKNRAGVSIKYVVNDRPSVFELSENARYTSDDGYSIEITGTGNNLPDYLLLETPEFIYSRVKTEEGFTYRKVKTQEPELLMMLKSRSKAVQMTEKSYQGFTVAGSVHTGNLYGYIIKGDPAPLTEDCLIQKDEYIYAVCRDPVETIIEKERKKPGDAETNSKEKKQTAPDTITGIQGERNNSDKGRNSDSDSSERKQEDILKTRISLNFREVPLKDAIVSICSQTGINVTLSKDIDQLTSISAYYEGLSIEDALKAITSGLDIAVRKEGNVYVITPFEERLFDVNKISIMQGGSMSQSSVSTAPSASPGPAQSGAQTAVSSPAAPSGGMPAPAQQPGTSAISGSGATDDEGINAIISAVRTLLSPRGVVSYLPTGFIYVKDSPSRIRTIESVLNMDNTKRREIK
ncbi:MAG: hypothetical protein QW561_02985, partial [Candidatus Aenigmatarchaeota archaeon]